LTFVRTLKVAIAGGGIGGLVLALGLRERKVDVEVHEQADELREVGAAVALSANGVRELQRLGLGEKLAAISTEPDALSVRRWKDGSSILRTPMGERYRATFGAPYYGVHRVPLLALLSEALGSEHITLGHRCVEATGDAQRAELSFAGGDRTSADVVVGADGVHSVIRSQIGGERPAVFSGTVGYRGLVRRSDLPDLPSPMALQFWAGPGRHLLHYPIDGGEVINFLAVVRTSRWDTSGWMEPCPVQDAIDAFDGWHPAVIAMVGATQEGSRWALHDYQPLERWHAGRCVLIGDAAHAMLPHQGQGANQTIEDAATLALCLAEADPDDPEPALAEYEARRRVRTARVQALSRWTADMLHLPDGPQIAQRDTRFNDPYANLAWIHGHDARDAAVAFVSPRATTSTGTR
jgi:salicylate hydroxylase